MTRDNNVQKLTLSKKRENKILDTEIKRVAIMAELTLKYIKMSESEMKRFRSLLFVLPVITFFCGLTLYHVAVKSFTNSGDIADKDTALVSKQFVNDQSAYQQFSLEKKIEPKANLYGKFIIQAGRFSNKKNALEFQMQLKIKNIESQILEEDILGKNSFVLVVDSFESKEKAKNFREALEAFYNVELFVREV